MKGVRFLGNCEVEIAVLTDPCPGEGEVLIDVKASGICGSEMGSYRSSNASEGNGGHEVMGVVLDPNGSRRFQKGDRVGVATIQGCGACHWCLQGKSDFCPQVGSVGNAHSELVVSKECWLHSLPPNITDGVAVLLSGDGLGVPYGASIRSGIQPGETTCVFGAGPVGLGMTLVQTFLGARVISVDLNPLRLEMAKNLGAWHTINPRQTEVREALLELTHGLGPNKCFECTGSQETLDIALDTTIPEGTVVVIGHGPQQINPQRLIARRNLRLMGNWICHFSDYDGMLTMIRNGLQADRLISAHFPLEEAAVAYQRFSEGLEAKVILTQ